MALIRKNVYELGGDWAPGILWYARGVAAMKAKALAEPTSWRFYGAMHGIDTKLWHKLGYLPTGDKKPSSKLQKAFWKQCQHGSWYFLPWHRGYLIAFEANVRAEVVKLGGPADWTLPYWNYFKPGQSALPPAFASADWPDGHGNNPLFVTQRYGPNNDGDVFVPVSEVNLKALTMSQFTGVSSGGSPGFGGVDTGFSHGGQVHGGLETQPHDWVHGLVGGGDPNNPQIPGLMSDPDTAGLDPIFWLHHANIDRLWEVWRRNPPSHVNPTDPNWVKGPGNVGERIFEMPMPDGSTWKYVPGDMVDLGTLGYGYDDYAAGGAAIAAPVQGIAGVAAVETGKHVELVGASQGAVPIQGGEVNASVHLDKAVRQKVTQGIAAAAAPDRVFLNLENVTGTSDATAFHVYVGLPDGAKPEDHPELQAGSIALFGVRKASLVDEEHGGQGLTFVLDITDIAQKLHLTNKLDVDALHVRFVPVHPVSVEANVKVGRVSVFRQGS